MIAPMNVRRGSPLSITAPDGAATLRVAGAGHSGEAAVSDGAAAFDTAEMPVGRYQSEWEDQVGALTAGPSFEVVPSLKTDKIKDAPLPWDERVLAAARQALLVAAGSTDVSFSVDATSYSFENRGELQAFVNRLESKLGRKKTPRRYRRWTA